MACLALKWLLYLHPRTSIQGERTGMYTKVKMIKFLTRLGWGQTALYT